MKKILWWIVIMMVWLVALYALGQYIFVEAKNAGFVIQKLEMGSLSNVWFLMLYIHIIASVIAIIIGPFTLSRKFRESNIKRHRFMGKLYLLGVWLGGSSGFYLAFYATGGMIASLGFALLAVLWIYTACMAYLTIRKKKIEAHRKWMIRNYALTLAAVSLRLYIPLSLVLFGNENFITSYIAIAWLCWVPNLIFAELLLRREALIDNPNLGVNLKELK